VNQQAHNISADIPNTYRFFVPAEALAHDTVVLDDAELVHQFRRVLRLRAGERVLLLDGQGTACVVVLTSLDREQIAGCVEHREAAQGEPATALALYVPLLRPERFEWALQKGTELGVSSFVPVQSCRSLPASQANERKLLRWRRIIREAAEQACRGRLPTLAEPLPFEQACAQAAAADLALLLWEGGNHEQTPASLRASLRQPEQPASVALLSGPEGGISPQELTTATQHGIMPISLGPRILRAETAPIAAASIIFYEFGETRND
jgi:16S rRNA (uracil1498-N3)-methyltransferase